MSLTALTIALTLAATPVMAASNLASVRWDKRVLLIFAPADSPALSEQLRLLGGKTGGISERDLLVLAVSEGSVTPLFGSVGSFDGQAIRTAFAPVATPFEVVLVGKDGGAKLRQTEPLPADKLFATIDAMPMRAEEMRHER